MTSGPGTGALCLPGFVASLFAAARGPADRATNFRDATRAKQDAREQCRPTWYHARVRLAAIDIGSNSVHMVIADVAADGTITVVERAKEMVRLGRGVFTSGRLSRDTMDLAVRTLRAFARLARARGARRLRAVATSAVREARNGPAFVDTVQRETGIRVRVITGRAEARLIQRAVTHSLGLDGSPYLFLDVGGGSVELGLVHQGRPLWLESMPLGVARLTEQFLGTDPPTPRERKRLKAHLEGELRDTLRRARRSRPIRAVGTSGTVNTLVAMACTARGDDGGHLHGMSAGTDEIVDLRRQVLAHDSAGRLDLPGMDAKRVDLMPAAVLLAAAILQGASVPELVACTWALREGILLDLAGVPAASGGSRADVRRRSVEALASHFASDNAHGRHTARLAVRLFDATARALKLPRESRELLEYAAHLHDIGRAIDHDRHHLHSAYLIRNGELLGFSHAEIEFIARIAQGHRKQPPKRHGPELQGLPAPLRRAVRPSATLLRLADALDHTHFSVIKDLSCSLTRSRLKVEVDSGGENANLELWAAHRRIDGLARLLHRPVVLRLRAAPVAAPKRRAVATS